MARLFRAVAHAERVHATNHYNVLKGYREEAKVSAGTPIGPGSTSHNLELAIAGEEYEV
ncbi:MAG: ferritin family protein, partial [Candidatus Korarchaeum sp.]